MKVLLTGATGALGQAILPVLQDASPKHELILACRPGSLMSGNSAASQSLLEMDLCRDDLGLSRTDRKILQETKLVYHLAALTKFRAPGETLREINSEGTKRLLSFFEQESPEAHFVHFSSTCVAGRQTGNIPETYLEKPPGFVNAYEESKWEAEKYVQAASLKTTLVRCATVIGSARDGRIGRPGAFHQMLEWYRRGLISVLPGDGNSRLDFLPLESVQYLTRTLLKSAEEKSPMPAVLQLSLGEKAWIFSEWINLAHGIFRQEEPAWQKGQIQEPLLASTKEFELFSASVRQSGDLLFNLILETMDSFLPELFYSKIYENQVLQSYCPQALEVDVPALCHAVISRHCEEKRKV